MWKELAQALMGMEEGITCVSATNSNVLVKALVLLGVEELGLGRELSTTAGGSDGAPGVIHEKLSPSLSSWVLALALASPSA